MAGAVGITDPLVTTAAEAAAAALAVLTQKKQAMPLG
jgi:hypothetical protein